uniref:Uncharacterized protein n=1 Tax=Entomoneis paludosa TaxID=265537 RepID=A0A7S2V741_9STRA
MDFETDVPQRTILTEKSRQCVPYVISRMTEARADRDIQSAGCAFLSSLCSMGGELPAFLLDNGAVGVISVATKALGIESDFQEVAEAGAWALWKLSAAWKQSEEPLALDVASIVHGLGVLGVVSMRYYESEIRTCLYGFALNVCGTDGLVLEDFPPVCDLLSSLQQNPSGESADLLAALCSHYPESCEDVLVGLDLPVVIEMLGSGDDLVLEPLISILVTVTENSVDAKRRLALDEVLSELVSTLPSTASDKNKCFILLDLTMSLMDGIAIPPQGLYHSILACLEHSVSDDTLRTYILRSTKDMVVLLEPIEEVAVLIPWLQHRIETLRFEVQERIEACNLVWAMASKRQIKDDALLRGLLVSVLSFMREFNGKAGQPLDITVLDVTGGALSGIALCIREFPIGLESHQIDTFIGAVYQARSYGAKAVNFVMAVLVAIWHFCFLHETELLREGVIVFLCDIMEDFKDYPRIQEKGCAIFAQLASAESLQISISIAEARGIELIVQAMDTHPTDLLIHSEASKAIAHLSTEKDVRTLVGALGGINSVLGGISRFSHSPIFLERAYSALLNLSSDVAEYLLDTQLMVRTIIQTLMLHPESGSLRENGLGILQNLCMKGLDAKEAVAAEGGIASTVNAMEQYLVTPNVVERGFSTLWSLAVLPANQKRIAQVGAIDIVVSAMYASTEHKHVQIEGCGCLFALALDPANRAAIRCAGGVEALTLSATVHYNKEEFQVEVCKLMACLSTPSDGQHEQISISQDEVDVVLFAMENFAQTEEVQVHGCEALVNFLKASNSAAIVSEFHAAMDVAVDTAAASIFGAQCEILANEFKMLLEQFSL